MLARLSQPLLLALLAALLEAAFLVLRGLDPLRDNVVEFIAVSFAAGLLYLLAAFLAFSCRSSSPTALAVVLLGAIAFRATLFSLPPTLSDDFYRYQWEGEVQVAGLNPYVLTPADLAQKTPSSTPATLPGADVPAVYAPLTELLFWLAAALDGQAAFKLLSVGFDLATLLVLIGLLRLRGQPPLRSLLYGWCPLVVLEFAGSGHNDSLALFFLVLASLLIIRGQAAVSIVALAAATLSKWFAALAVPVFLRRARWWGAALFAATGLLIASPYLGAGANLPQGLLAYAAQWRNNSSLYDVLVAATTQEAVASGVALGIVVGLALYFTLERAEPLPACCWLLAATLFLSPSVFPWYVTWLVPFLCFYPHPALLLFTVSVLLSYHVLIDYVALGVWHYTPWLVWLEYLPVYALLLWRWKVAPGRAVKMGSQQ